jgi:hypothetical protein
LVIGAAFLAAFICDAIVLAKQYKYNTGDRFAKLRAAISIGILVETAIGGFHYLLLAEPILALWLKFSGMTCQVMVCYFFCALGLAITHQRPCLYKVMLPMNIVLGIFNTALLVYGLVAWKDEYQCLSLVWILFVVLQVLNAIVFFAASRLILPKLQGTPSEYRKVKIVQLKTLYWINIASCVIVSIYEVFNHLLTRQLCDRWLIGYPALNSLIYIAIRSIEYIIPLGAVIWIFWNWRKGLPKIESKANSIDSTQQQKTSNIEDDELELSASQKDEDDNDDDHPNPRLNPVAALFSRTRPYSRITNLTNN